MFLTADAAAGDVTGPRNRLKLLSILIQLIYRRFETLFNLRWRFDILLDGGLPEGIYFELRSERDNQQYSALEALEGD